MLRLVLLLLLGQGVVTQLPRRPGKVGDPVATLLDPKSDYAAMSTALDRLTPKLAGAAPELRAGLELELKQPRLRMLPDAEHCERSDTKSCDVMIEPCLPRAGFLVLALEGLKALDGSAELLKKVLARGEPLSTNAAADALARVEPAALVDLNRARLKSEDPFCRNGALGALVPLLDRPEIREEWLATLRGGRGHERAIFARTVA